MKYVFNGKNLNIPDADLKKSMEKFGLSQDEAIQLWLEDNDYSTNEEVETLSAKAKEFRRYEKSDKERKKVTKERKIDEEKKFLLNLLISAINAENCIDAVKNESEFSFTFGENSYSVKLIKHRPPKN